MPSPPVSPFQLAVGLMILTYVWRIQSIYPQLQQFKILMVATIAAIGLAFLDSGVRTRLSLLNHRIMKLIFFLLGLMLLGIPFALLPSWAFHFLTQDHIKTVLMAIVIALAIRSFVDVERLVIVCVGGAVLYTFEAISYVRSGNSWNWLGAATVGLGDNLFYYDANDFAMLVVMTIPLAAYFLRRTDNLLLWLFGLGSFGVLVYAVVESGSRGAFLGLIAVGIYLLFGFRMLPKKIRLGLAGTMLAGLLVLGSTDYWERMASILEPTEDTNWNYETGRRQVWKRGIGYMMSNPVLGVGAGNFEKAEGFLAEEASRQQFGRGWKWSAAHNSFVEIGAETGVVGLVAFLALIWISIKEMRKISARTRDGPRRVADQAGMAQALVGSMVGFCVAGFFLSQAFSTYLYTILALMAGMVFATAGMGGPAARSVARPLRRPPAPAYLRPGRPPRHAA